MSDTVFVFFHKTNYLIALILFPFFLFTSCQKNEIEDINTDFEYEFFPLAIGHQWLYQADSIVFDPVVGGIQLDTATFLIRETITDTLRDNTGRLLYRIQYAEKRGDDPWMTKFVYTARRESTRAVRNENNLHYIKMVFPITEGSAWEGNAFIDEKTIINVAGEPIELFKGWDEYRVLNRHESHTVNGKVYDDVLEIEQVNYETLLELRKSREYYAKNIGLIDKEMEIFDTQCRVCCTENGNVNFGRCTGVEWSQKAEKGFILRKKLLSFRVN